MTIEPEEVPPYVPIRRMRLATSALAIMGQKAGYNTAHERARKIGISISHLRHLERGEFMPSARLVDAMAHAYKRPIEQIERAAALCVERLAERKIAHIRGF